MLIHKNRRHFHLMPTYRPFFNDYLPHSLSKWALHPRLLSTHNFIGKKTPLPPLFTLIPECVFESAGCVFEHQWRRGCKCLLSLFFTEIKRNNRGMGGDKGGGGEWGRRHDGRKWGRVGDCPGRASHCRRDKVCQCGITSLSDCVSCLLKSLTSLPTLP